MQTTGSQELWSAIISHLRTFLERFGTTHHATTTTAAITTTTDDGVDSLMVDEICRIVTDSLINTAGRYLFNLNITNITQP